MAEIVNLRHARKQRARDEKNRRADQNRALHGRSKAERSADKKIRETAAAMLEGHRRDQSGQDDAD